MSFELKDITSSVKTSQDKASFLGIGENKQGKIQKSDLVSSSSDFETLLFGQKRQHDTEQKSETTSVAEVILIKSQHGIKMEKRDDTYIVLDTKNRRAYPYRSITWADKKYLRLSNVFARA
jgi:hypothetical protein